MLVCTFQAEYWLNGTEWSFGGLTTFFLARTDPCNSVGGMLIASSVEKICKRGATFLSITRDDR